MYDAVAFYQIKLSGVHMSVFAWENNNMACKDDPYPNPVGRRILEGGIWLTNTNREYLLFDG
jgi:hypothetical protein